jgi:hypothetical protein
VAIAASRTPKKGSVPTQLIPLPAGSAFPIGKNRPDPRPDRASFLGSRLRHGEDAGRTGTGEERAERAIIREMRAAWAAMSDPRTRLGADQKQAVRPLRNGLSGPCDLPP